MRDRGAAVKPYVHPIHAPNGRLLTRVSPPDHEWHRALWFAIKYVNGENFWEESPDEPFGDQFPLDDDGTAIEWRRPDGEVVIDETRAIVRRDGGRVIDWTTTLVPRVDVRLDRTPYTTWGGYGGLTLRGAGDWEDTRLLLADGSVHRRPEGVPSPWCDLSSDDSGLLFLDHPDNVRHPVPWYGATRSRVYGTDGWSNYLNAAFLFHDGLDVAAGSALTLRYRVLAHDGAWSVDECDAAWRRWIDG
jgi:hypothetical protein